MTTKKRLDEETENWLVAFVAGELERDEAARAQEWVTQGQEHRAAYEALRRDYWRIRWMEEERMVEDGKAWKRIAAAMGRRRSYRMHWAVAACATILLGVAVALLLQPERQGAPMAQEYSHTTGPQATLVLSTGEQVSLGNVQRDFQEQDGSQVAIDSAAGIRYDAQAVPPEVEEPIYNKIIVPRGGEYMVKLADGTEVWLDAGSELKYPVQFLGEQREVWLRGRGYFSVEKQAGKPFVVRVEEMAVQVYGTEFNVDAYDEHHVVTVLVEGSIGLRAGDGGKEIRLHPNQLAETDTGTGESEVREVDVAPYVAWRHRSIVFANERLERILEEIARWYDVEIFFQNEELKELRFACNLPRYATPREFFHFMERISEARFSMKGRTVIVSKK